MARYLSLPHTMNVWEEEQRRAELDDEDEEEEEIDTKNQKTTPGKTESKATTTPKYIFKLFSISTL